MTSFLWHNHKESFGIYRHWNWNWNYKVKILELRFGIRKTKTNLRIYWDWSENMELIPPLKSLGPEVYSFFNKGSLTTECSLKCLATKQIVGHDFKVPLHLEIRGESPEAPSCEHTMGPHGYICSIISARTSQGVGVGVGVGMGVGVGVGVGGGGGGGGVGVGGMLWLIFKWLFTWPSGIANVALNSMKIR